MPILYKTKVIQRIKELDEFHNRLRNVLLKEPPADIYDAYAQNPEDFKRDFVQLDFDEIERCIKLYEVEIKMLKQLNKKANHAPRKEGK